MTVKLNLCGVSYLINNCQLLQTMYIADFRKCSLAIKLIMRTTTMIDISSLRYFNDNIPVNR